MACSVGSSTRCSCSVKSAPARRSIPAMSVKSWTMAISSSRDIARGFWAQSRSLGFHCSARHLSSIRAKSTVVARSLGRRELSCSRSVQPGRMSYRDVSESLRAYRDRVANDLDEARRAAREAAERASKVAILEKELAETEGLLAKMGGARRGLPLLDDVRDRRALHGELGRRWWETTTSASAGSVRRTSTTCRPCRGKRPRRCSSRRRGRCACASSGARTGRC